MLVGTSLLRANSLSYSWIFTFNNKFVFHIGLTIQWGHKLYVQMVQIVQIAKGCRVTAGQARQFIWIEGLTQTCLPVTVNSTFPFFTTFSWMHFSWFRKRFCFLLGRSMYSLFVVELPPDRKTLPFRLHFTLSPWLFFGLRFTLFPWLYSGFVSLGILGFAIPGHGFGEYTFCAGILFCKHEKFLEYFLQTSSQNILSSYVSLCMCFCLSMCLCLFMCLCVCVNPFCGVNNLMCTLYPARSGWPAYHVPSLFRLTSYILHLNFYN